MWWYYKEVKSYAELQIEKYSIGIYGEATINCLHLG